MRTSAAIGLIGGSSYIALVASVVRSIIIMRLIGPHGRGVQRLAGLIKGYLTNVSMPWRHGVAKELPLAIGAADSQRAAEVEDAGFFATSLFTAIAAAGMIFYAVFVSAGDWETRVAIATGGALLLAEDVGSLYWSTLRSWGRFRLLALGEIVRTISQFALMVVGAWALGVTGVMLGWLSAALLLLLYLEFASRIAIRTRIRWEHVWRLARIGIPVTMISFSDVLLRSIDGTILVRFYGEEQLGLYSLAMQMAGYLYALPRAAGFVLWPKVLQSYGAADDLHQKRRRVLLPTIGLSAVMPVIGGAAWVLLPMMVAVVVPDFLPAVPAAQVLSLGAIFLALPMSVNAALVASNREPLVITANLVGALIAGGGTWYVVAHAGSLLNVAAFAVAGFAVSALISLWLQLGEFAPSAGSRFGEVLLALAPTVWVIASLWATARLMAMTTLDPQSIGGAIIALLLFTFISLPCLAYAERRIGIVSEIRALLASRFRH